MCSIETVRAPANKKLLKSNWWKLLMTMAVEMIKTGQVLMTNQNVQMNVY